MKQRDSYTNPHNLVWISGWVFADLMLGLFVIFLVSSRGASVDEIAAMPLPTETSAPTRTPTLTKGPPPTLPLPTHTPLPTLKPTATAVPALAIGLDRTPYFVTLRTDPTLFLSNSESDKQNSNQQFRDQVQSCLGQLTGSKAGMILATGYNIDAANGHALAKQALKILTEEIRHVFEGSVQKDLHALTNDPYLNGMVTLEIYFLTDPQFRLPKEFLGKSCTPPPKTWCQGKESAQVLIVFNWDTFPYLSFNLNNQAFKIKPANGTPPKAQDGTVGCIMVSPGRYTWSAGAASDSLNVIQGKDPEPIRLCGSPARLCPDGPLPTTTGPGIVSTPSR